MKFNDGQLVRIKHRHDLNPDELRIIVGYEEEKRLYLSKRATKKGKIDKRSEEWILRCPEERLEPVEFYELKYGTTKI